MKKHTYVLGTGLSHDGSACLLKDGEICVAIEKERLSKIKHDGYNDTMAINYCLEAEGITLNDLDLVVQSALWGGTLETGNSFFRGDRLFTQDIQVPIVSISHHLAHAYSAVGRCPFEEDFNVMIIDGSGAAFADCIDIENAFIPEREKIHEDVSHLYFEKDSYYIYSEEKLQAVYKDFSAFGYYHKQYPAGLHSINSIGDVYQGTSQYCLGDYMDVGKLMGLSPYGSPGVYSDEIFHLQDGRVYVNYDWIRKLNKPAMYYGGLKADFKYYADIAYHVQKEVERAILYIIRERMALSGSGNLCYAGGVALNAVANQLILSHTDVRRLYIQPAAGDNGISIGCAYFGWLVTLGNKRKIKENSSTCFGMSYDEHRIECALTSFKNRYHRDNLHQRTDNLFRIIGLNYNPESIGPYRAVIQFEIEGYCAYQIIIQDQRIECKKGRLLPATCIVELDQAQLDNIIRDPSYMTTLWDAGRIRISNLDDLGLLLRVVNLSKVVKDDGINSGTIDKDILDNFVYAPDYIERTAALLAQGKVIAWFQGGAEFGPRALGRRSILADPRTAGIRDFINLEIKFREDFRPFAPAVLREDVGTYFQTDRESPYMILVDHVRDDWHDKIKSVVHRNNTSRIQTVTPDWNPAFYSLLKAFKEITGISVLLNTSLNRRGMPIVESPQDALEFFYSCKLDYLVLDKFIVSK